MEDVQEIAFTPAEKVSDMVVHVLGVVLALMAVPVLITLAVWKKGDLASVLAISVYGACLLSMLGCSALYNITYGGARSHIWKRLDHSAIYLKIAGTFTPLVALTGGAGFAFLAGLWGVALGGTSLKVLAPDRLKWFSLALYLGLGWVGTVLGWGVITALSPAAAWLVVVGGCLYTAGVAFFLWKGLPHHTTIWHGFVLVASALLYAAVLVEVVRVV